MRSAKYSICGVLRNTAKNTVILPNFLMWNFAGAFPQNPHTRKLDEITVFFTV